ncbi:MAG: alpha/beta hydrolase family protein [Sphingomicrobium sp.]
MRTEQFDFPGAAGQKLSGAIDLPDGEVCAYALFAHCFTCTKSSLATVRISRALAARGIAVLRYDFTGLGASEGEFGASTFSGNVGDLLAAAHAMTGAGRDVTLLIGHSLGGAAVLAAAGGLSQVKAVATIGAPLEVGHVKRLFGDNLEQLLREGEASVSIGGRPFVMRRSFIDDLEKHDQSERIHKLKRPLLVMHAPLDQTVSIDNAGSIFAAALHPKSFVSLDRADHLLTDARDAQYCADMIATWASRYVSAMPSLAQ